MYLVVIERDNRISNPNARDRFIGGSPCVSYEGARELVCAHLEWGSELIVSYIENGTNYAEIDQYTGEVIKEFFVRELKNVPGI